MSDREAGFVNACADKLSALCDRDGLPDDKPKLDADDFVTRRGGQSSQPEGDAPAMSKEDPAPVGDQAEPEVSLEELLDLLEPLLPPGPQLFPDGMVTDQPERVIVAEMIREKALLHLRDEVPHGIGVEMLAMKRRGDLMEIHATIYCERAAHKGIIIGKQGAMLGKIGSEARRDIEKLLNTHVLLKLWVKVREDWRNRENVIRSLGYN